MKSDHYIRLLLGWSIKLPKMKKTLIVVFPIVLLSIISYSQTISSKLGFSGTLYTEDLGIVSKFTWYYNWGTVPLSSVSDSVSDYIEYVPMIWGAGFDETALRDYLTDHPEVEYLLGFNEPNISTQSNLGPEAAAAEWPLLEAVADDFDLTLVGPAPVAAWPGVVVIENGIEYNEPDDWYDAFFEACAGCRVDHIAVHAYYNSTGTVSSLLERMSKYGKPIWLTEFNHSSYDGDGNNITTYSSQAAFMETVVPVLEGNPDVFRYAWFMNRCPQPNTNLFAGAGVLTSLGDLYAGLGSGNMEGVLEGYTYVCDEGATVEITDTMTVAYGANGVFHYRYGVTENCGCTSDVFGGDPIYGYVKACYTKPYDISDGPTEIHARELNNEVSVYPNPTSNEIRIRGIIEEATIYIYETSGKLLLMKTLGKSDHILDISALHPGIYILHVVQNGKAETIRLIKES